MKKINKYLLLMVVFSIAVLVSSCGSDNNDETEESVNNVTNVSYRSLLVGRWVKECNVPEDSPEEYTFNSDGTGSMIYNDKIESFKDWALNEENGSVSAYFTSGRDAGRRYGLVLIADLDKLSIGRFLDLSCNKVFWKK